MTAPRSTSLLLLAAGFGIWAVAFVVLYSMLSVGCAFGWQAVDTGLGLTLQRLQLVLLTGLFLAGHGALLMVMRRAGPDGPDDTARFVRTVAFQAAIAAFAASAFNYFAIAFLSTCNP